MNKIPDCLIVKPNQSYTLWFTGFCFHQSIVLNSGKALYIQIYQSVSYKMVLGAKSGTSAGLRVGTHFDSLRVGLFRHSLLYGM